jgi:hypothetical protein
MQYVDGFLELGDVHHAVNTACLPDPNLPRARTYLVERLPVGRLKLSLDFPQLEARFLPGVSWECQQIVVGGPYPRISFSSSTEALCIKFYTRLRLQVKVLGER